MKFCLQFIVFLAICILVRGQEPLSRKYTTKDGLASNTVYHVLSDKKGFLWFATDAGVSLFDGTTFRNFTVKDGLEDNEVLAMFEDNDGRIWFYCYNKLPCFYYKGKIFNSKNFSELNKIHNYNWLLLCRRLHETWFAGAKNIYRFKDDKITPFPLPDSHGLLLLTEIDSVLYAVTQNDFYAFHEATQRFEKDTRMPSAAAFFTRVHDLGNGHYLFVTSQADKSTDFYKCTVNARLHQLKLQKWGHFTKEVTNCITDKQQHVALVIFADNTVAKEDLDADTMHNNVSYKFRSVASGTTVDIQGNRWITLLDGGVEMFPANRSSTIAIPEDKGGISACYSLYNMNGTIVAGTNDNRLLFIKNGQLVDVQHMNKYSHRDRVLDIKADSQQQLWIGEDNGICVYNIKNKQLRYLDLWGNIKDIKYDSATNKMLVASSLGSFTIDCNKDNTITFLNHQRTTSVRGTENDLWYSTLDDLYQHTNTGAQAKTDLYNQMNSRITCLDKDTRGRTWVGTSSKGLFLIDNNKVTAHLNTENGLASDICRNLFIENEESVWTCTNMGISHVTFKNGGLTTTTYNDNNCLADNNVNDVLVIGDTVYVAGNTGITMFNKGSISSSYGLPTYITKIKYGNDELVTEDSSSAIKINQNTLTIYFSGLSYTSSGNIRYEYYLEGVNDKPLLTKNGSITFSGLAPGTYNFYVSGIDILGNKSKIPAHITFTILPAWYQQIWLRVLAIVLVASIIAIITYYISKRYEKRRQLRNELRQTISHLELDAIKQQIDPHFIFNCLNAIQGVIYKSDTDTAAYFINRFAKLMRKGLMLSKETFISVDEEYSFLDNYLEVEQLRLNKSFDYTITIDPSINKSEPIVPAFIVHPFVENAINHGIKYVKGQKGKIDIRFICTDRIEIHLEDNGIGINASKKLKEANPSGHNSKGISLILSRVESLNKLYGRDISVQIADRSDKHPGEKGTIVIISFNIKDTSS